MEELDPYTSDFFLIELYKVSQTLSYCSTEHQMNFVFQLKWVMDRYIYSWAK